MSQQKTRLAEFQSKIISGINNTIEGPWKRRSLGIISLLIGYYLGSNGILFYLEKTGQRPIVVLIILIMVEILVRLRSRVKEDVWPLNWLILDNLRIGIVYAIVLEAFKLGS